MLTSVVASNVQAQFPTNCKVEVVVCNMCMGSQLGREARVIVTEAARLLADHQIGIQLQLAASNSTAPTPQTLQHLAPVLTQLGHYSFPEWQPDPRQQSSETWREYRRRFDIDHLEVMQSGFRHLSMLCIRLYCNTWEALQDMMAALAALHSLKVLHLKIITDKPFVRFRGLDGLQCLEDVALWCHNRADCGSLINVSSQTLRTVKLFAQQWDLNTYEALQSVVKLDSLVIDVYVMTPSEANALKSVSAKYLQLKLHTPGPSVLAALSTAQLHRLVLSHLTDDASAQLGQLQSLESLTIMESLHFSGKELQTQAGVTELVLTSCHGVKRAGLWHIVKTALPALVTVSILPFGHGPGYLLCSHALQAFSFGKHLKSVDLSGVDGITSSMFSEMQQKFHGRQFRGVAQQIVLVHLPAQVPRLPTPEEDSRPTGTVVMSCR